jgi:dipeptidyl aminopeptidase/acylaminoacyl peptidase
MPRAILLSVSCVVLVSAAAVAEPPVRDHDIQPEDYFTQGFITSCAMSPDGSRIAYTEMRWEPDRDARNTDLWQVDTRTRAVTRLTFDPAADAGPRWSADGQWIYFTSSRKRGDEEVAPYNGKTQVWRVRPNGGEMVPVTREPEGIQGYDLSLDGRTLYYTVGTEQVVDDRWKALKKSHDGVEYGHGVITCSALWSLDLESWRAEKLVDERRVIGAFAVAPDKRRIAMITTPTEELITNEGWSRVDVYDADTGLVRPLPDRRWREEAPSPYGWIVDPVWSSNGQALALRVDFDGYPGEVFVARFDGAGNEPAIDKVERPGEVSVQGAMLWLPETDDLCFVAEDHARTRVYRLRGVGRGEPGGSAVITPGDVVVEMISVNRAGDRLAMLMRDPRNPGDLYVVPTADGATAYERMTRINPQVDRWKIPDLQVVRWTSRDGTEVEGILELPAGYEPGDGPLPMVVEVHGGPTASTGYAFQFWIYGRTIFASRGWALFSPNYRGSTGYGDEFLTDLIGNKNVLDVQDILSGVDALVERGIADPDRLAVMGWSNGGYLTNCLITASNRFKAASSGAGVFDTVMQWSIEDTPGHVINYSQGLPWTNPRRMHDSSPLYQVDRVTTPTLIHVGENDARVPVEHSRSLHRSLHHYLNVPCELVVYPGAGHGLTKYTHRKAKLEWDLNWFDYWVLGKEP